MFNDNNFDALIIDKYFKENILALDDYYKHCNYIINPQTINRCLLIQKKVKTLAKLLNDPDIKIEEHLNNVLGWNYSISMKGICFGFAGKPLDLFNELIALSDSIDFCDYAIKLNTIGTQIIFSINNVYLPL
jgi:hypothetical protein